MSLKSEKRASSIEPLHPEQSHITTFQNPLRETDLAAKPKPCIIVIFGASGDLTHRKIMPALFNLFRDHMLPGNFVCVGFARREKTHESFRNEIRESISQFSRTKPSEEELGSFLQKLFYHRAEFHEDQGYQTLFHFLKELDTKFGTESNRLFYMSVQPDSFPLIIEKLHQNGLVYDANDQTKFSRVVVEKPFGRDFASATALQADLMQNLSERQIFRIDHYLGKETVQNLLVFRFSNGIFENLWNNRYIDNIQITVAENIGIGSRGSFYERMGLARDIIQNHVMQLLTLTMMEPPTNLLPEAIRDEKVKVLEALQPFANEEEILRKAVRGQYKEGFIEGEAVKAYRSEENISKESDRETFAAFRMQVENWRWSGVPIYVRAGKRLAKRATEIVIVFKKTPNILFHKEDHHNIPNCLIFRIQPDEGISIRFNSKVPGTSGIIQPVKMDFGYEKYFGKDIPEAYERLIYDAMLGDSTLFARVDESLNSWKFFTPILEHWESASLHPDEEFYPAGSWGPSNADFLLKRENRIWKNI